MQDFRKLRVWQRAQELCVQIYLFSADFPVEERYGMAAQLRCRPRTADCELQTIKDRSAARPRRRR